jgi:hypothetical protein
LANVESLAETMMRVVDHLPNGDEFDLIVLKGHLLAEEQLNLLLEGLARNTEPLEKERLRFPQLVALCQAFTAPGADPSWPWAHLLSLNSLRNKMAHHLEPPQFESRVMAFIELVDSVPGWPRSPSAEGRAERLRHAIAMIIGALHHIRRAAA